jgi:Helicase associated domain
VTKRARAAPTRVPWEDRVAALTAYKAEHGHLNIPIRYKANPSMGKFVHNMREQYKLFHNKCKPGYQKRCSLTAERIAELDAIGFLWTTERVKRQNEDWESRLEQLKEYKAKHGVRLLRCSCLLYVCTRSSLTMNDAQLLLS